MQPIDPRLLARACAILAKRDHSEYELRRKLTTQSSFTFSRSSHQSARKTFSPTIPPSLESIDSVIQYCYDAHWLDDRRFTHTLIRQCVAKNYGQKKIEFKLREKGIPQEIIYSLLAESEIDWVELARNLIIKHFGSSDLSHWKIKAKIYHYLAKRGFCSDEINEAFRYSENTYE